MKQFSLALLLGLTAVNAQASLIDRGGGLLYDDVLNITWLQDATYGQRIEQDGNISVQPFYTGLQAWVDNLVYHDSVRNVDYSDWRLPKVRPVNGSEYDLYQKINGSTDWGINISGTQSELGYMYYQNLGLKATFSPTQQYQPDWGPAKGGEILPVMDVGLVRNLYTGDIGYLAIDDSANAYANFSFHAGLQTVGYLNGGVVDLGGVVWLVRDGDVAGNIALNGPAPVPLPATATLLLSALLSLLSRRYFRTSEEAI